MIMTDDEYEFTQEWVGKFQAALDHVRRLLSESEGDGDDNTRKLRKIEASAFQYQIEKLQTELAEYDTLRSGERIVVKLNSLADLPRTLIKARITAGLTQRDLAERLDVDEEQVQRDEETEYESATVGRLIDIADILGLTLGTEIALPVRSAQAA